MHQISKNYYYEWWRKHNDCEYVVRICEKIPNKLPTICGWNKIRTKNTFYDFSYFHIRHFTVDQQKCGIIITLERAISIRITMFVCYFCDLWSSPSVLNSFSYVLLSLQMSTKTFFTFFSMLINRKFFSISTWDSMRFYLVFKF